MELDTLHALSTNSASLQAGDRNIGDAADMEFKYTVAGLDTSLASVPEDTSRAVAHLVARLRIVFKDKTQYRRLLGCRGSRAQKVLNLFQQLLDHTGLNAGFKRNLIVATQRLSKETGQIPACYNLKDVHYSSGPVAAGGFADIYKGSFRGQAVCVKVVRLYQTSPLQDFLQACTKEALLWRQLTHPNVCPFYGLYRRKSGICLVSPWMENGNLSDYLKRCPQADRLLLVHDTAQGLLYLHDSEIVHGDLKGANILVSASGRARLADFGLSSVAASTTLAWTSHSFAASKGGTVRWQAPELFDFENDEIVVNTKASDVYAWSSVGYEAFTSTLPFSHLTTDAAVMYQVKVGNRPLRPADDSASWGTWGLTEGIWSIMMDCWSTDPSLRPTIHDIAKRVGYISNQDQRPTDDENALSPAQFHDEMGTRWNIVSVDAFEKLVEIDPVPPSGSHNQDPVAINQGASSLEHETPHAPLPVVAEAGYDLAESYVNSILNLASAYDGQGRLEEAASLRASVMEMCREMLRMNNLKALRVVSNAADSYFWQARYQDAGELWSVVVEKRKRMLGIDDPDTLQSMYDLGCAYGEQKRWGEAEKLLVEAVEKRRKISGLDDPSTLATMAHLTRVYFHLGCWKEAEELIAVVVEKRKQMLGVDNPDTLESMSDLALSHIRQGLWEQAEELLVVVVEKYKQTLGVDSPRTLESMSDLASSYIQQGRWKEAEELLVVIVEKYKETLGADDPQTLKSMSGLALSRARQGRWGDAEELLVVVVEKHKQAVGVDSPRTLESMSDLASSYTRQGRWKEAEELLVVVVGKRKETLGADHPRTLKSMSDLALACARQGQWKEAKELLVAMVERHKKMKMLGMDNPDTLRSMSDLALSYARQSQWKTAGKLFEVVETVKRELEFSK